MFLALVLLCSATVTLTAKAAPDAATRDTTRAVEMTFLKSQPGQRDNLRKFIVANWFAMDRIAQSRGLIHDYKVFDSGTDEGAWNVVVATTYTNAAGYAGIAEAFEQIRRAHKTVAIEGKTIKELGTVVQSATLYENPAELDGTLGHSGTSPDAQPRQ